MNRQVAFINPEVHRQFCEAVNPKMYRITPEMKREAPFVNLFDGEIMLCPRCLERYLKPDPDQNVWFPLEDVEGYDLSFQICVDCSEEIEALENDQVALTGDVMEREDHLQWHIAHIFDNA